MARSDHPPARDAPGHGGARGVREGVVLVAVGVALLGLAAWSASRASIGDTSPDIPTNVSGNEAARNDALLVAVGALVAAIVIFIAPAFARWGRGRAKAGEEIERRRPQPWWVVATAMMLAIAALFVIMLAARNRPEQTQPVPLAPATTEPVQPQVGERAGAQGWTAAALVAAGAIAAGTAVVLWRRRGRARRPIIFVEDRAFPQPIAPVDLEALAPVDAVRAAYAAARVAIAPMGVAPRPPETPYEYLDRVRATAPNVERPVATLTRLFEVARFSHHPVTPAMKADAIAAYDEVADEVARARDAAVLT